MLSYRAGSVLQTNLDEGIFPIDQTGSYRTHSTRDLNGKAGIAKSDTLLPRSTVSDMIERNFPGRGRR